MVSFSVKVLKVAYFNFFQPTPMSRFVAGYVGAVTSAVGIAVSIVI